MDTAVTASSGQPESPVRRWAHFYGNDGTVTTVELPPSPPLPTPNPMYPRVLDYAGPVAMTEATGRAILAQLHILQEQQADLAAAVQLLVESGRRSGLVMAQGQYVG